ncbi:MAG: adenylate/guanylate cyclase domain-containing protein [bacterium]|nr:adenylate/guanylate cyclase domain-containing protein [bacterium]
MTNRTREKIRMILTVSFISALIGGLYSAIYSSFEPADMLQGLFIGGGITFVIMALHFSVLQKLLKRIRFTLVTIIQTFFFLAIIIGIFFVSYLLFDDTGVMIQNAAEFFIVQLSPVPVLVAFGGVLLLVFLLEMNELLGRRVLFNYFIGTYHNPKEEERVFMFLDLKSSTTIAEKIGHKDFHRLVNDFFFSITGAIIENRGEIYKYVGDEAIITWKMKQGIKKAYCIQCFFDALEGIENQREMFLGKYGIVPEFKAGIHCGTVITGEMGDIKKEIAYLGDTVNTAARVEAQCNEKGKKLLVSGDLLEQLDLPEIYTSENMGAITLRGKEKEVELFSIEKK